MRPVAILFGLTHSSQIGTISFAKAYLRVSSYAVLSFFLSTYNAEKISTSDTIRSLQPVMLQYIVVFFSFANKSRPGTKTRKSTLTPDKEFL